MSQSTANSMTTAALQPLLQLLESKGVSSRELLTATGLDASAITDPNQRISIHHFDRVLEQCSCLLNDQAIGIRVGQRLELTDFYLLGFLISSCQSGREVLAMLRRYYSLISDSRSPDFYIGHNSIKIVFYVTDGSAFGNRARAELIAAGIHSVGEAMGGHYYKIQGVGFRCSPPPYRDHLNEFFGLKVEYNQPQNWISACGQHLDSPLIHANPVLFKALRTQAEQAISRFSRLQAFSQKVMHVLNQWPEFIPITKRSVAELLNTSSRTLTRRLQAEGCQFSVLVKEVRLEKARQALQNDQTDVQQLALNLGFSDRRGFERAFKQWTGETPASYRRRYRSHMKESVVVAG